MEYGLLILVGLALVALSTVLVILILRPQPKLNIRLLEMYERAANSDHAPDAVFMAEVAAKAHNEAVMKGFQIPAVPEDETMEPGEQVINL